MKIHLALSTDNAAFEDAGAGTELARILRKIAGQLEDWPGDSEFTIGLHDANGNKVGTILAEH